MKGLNDGGQYASRPVGNSPELMPLDCGLFKDLDDAVDRHIAVTSSLPDTNKRQKVFEADTETCRIQLQACVGGSSKQQTHHSGHQPMLGRPFACHSRSSWLHGSWNWESHR